MRSALCPLIVVAALGLASCSTEPKQDSDKREVASDVQNTLSRFNGMDPQLQELLDRSYGYVVFPEVGKGGLIVGGAYGHGEVFEQGRKVGYASISQATVGLQAGAQSFSELIIFETHEALDRFKGNELSFEANASAVAIKSGAVASSTAKDGVRVFTQTRGGLMAEAAIGGQKFNYQPM